MSEITETAAEQRAAELAFYAESLGHTVEHVADPAEGVFEVRAHRPTDSEADADEPDTCRVFAQMDDRDVGGECGADRPCRWHEEDEVELVPDTVIPENYYGEPRARTGRAVVSIGRSVDVDACTARGEDPRAVERTWPGRVTFVEGKTGMWVVDRRWAVAENSDGKWVAIDLPAGGTVERNSVGSPAETLGGKIGELIGGAPDTEIVKRARSAAARLVGTINGNWLHGNDPAVLLKRVEAIRDAATKAHTDLLRIIEAA